ncbi:MAG TPA: hypothetical protein PK109_03070 [Candidatus Paceibacterota bacterium]|nr:hypothetical protein [Candidatus Paceibacterota bacterium]
MSWAAERRTLILAIVGVVILAIASFFAYQFFHQAPSCTDGKQNQEEEGIDCGGTCTYLCAAKLVAPSVSFARELPQNGGRTDVIAYIKNPNPSAAAKGVAYTVELYNAERAVVATKKGTVDLAPALETPVYIPNFNSGNQEVDRVFISIDNTLYRWFRFTEEPKVPTVASPQVSGTEAAPRVTAVVTNPFPTALKNIKLVATVFDGEGNAIAASQTVVPTLIPQGRADAVFTWNAPFPGIVSRIDVKPIVPLPAP